MVAQAVEILDRYGVNVISYTAGFGTPGVSREEAVKIFETAKAIGAPVLAQGFHPENGPLVKELAETYNIKMGLENHPEKNPQEVINKVAPFSPWVGSAIDTGWFATQGYDPVQAVRELKDYIVHVHLKDIKAAGAHDTCALGDGVVDIKGVMAELKAIGYTGPMTVEHEPHTYDPTEEVKVSLQRVKAWEKEL
jgi:sugar phosphate isomerase/epimerase